MVFQKDYILRMIEMIGELIAGILGYLKKGEYGKARESLDNAYFQFLKDDASFFQSLEKEKLCTDLLHKHNYTNGHLEVLSELFFAEGEMALAQQRNSESKVFFEKSLILLEFVINESRTFSVEKNQHIELIRSRISSIDQ